VRLYTCELTVVRSLSHLSTPPIGEAQLLHVMNFAVFFLNCLFRQDLTRPLSERTSATVALLPLSSSSIANPASCCNKLLGRWPSRCFSITSCAWLAAMTRRFSGTSQSGRPQPLLNSKLRQRHYHHDGQLYEQVPHLHHRIPCVCLLWKPTMSTSLSGSPADYTWLP